MKTMVSLLLPEHLGKISASYPQEETRLERTLSTIKPKGSEASFFLNFFFKVIVTDKLFGVGGRWVLHNSNSI